MIEGWLSDGYLVLFEGQKEEAIFTQRYGVSDSFPGYVVAGLWGWDDFILRDEKGTYFIVPTVPLANEYLQPFTFETDVSKIKPDERFSGKIK